MKSGALCFWFLITDYERLVRKWLQRQKSTPTPKFLGMAEAYFVCHKFSDFFGLCLHWVSVVRGLMCAPTIWSNTPLKVGRIMSPYVTSQWALSPFNRWSVRPMMVQLRLLTIKCSNPTLMPDLKVCRIMLQISQCHITMTWSVQPLAIGPSKGPTKYCGHDLIGVLVN